MTTTYAPPAALPAQRTPPELKWLLNERAALTGEYLSRCTRAARLQAQMERLREQQLALGPVLDTLRTRIEALDRVIELAHPQVPPDAGGQVNAWRGRWGPRGALTDYLLKVLKDAAPVGLPVQALFHMACTHFSVHFENADDRDAVRLSFRSRLRQIRDRTEQIHSQLIDGQSVWYWRPGPTLSDIRALAKAAEERTLAGNANSDASRPEVGIERTGGSER